MCLCNIKGQAQGEKRSAQGENGTTQGEKGPAQGEEKVPAQEAEKIGGGNRGDKAVDKEEGDFGEIR